MTDYEELENGANPEPEDLEAFREAGKSIADALQPTIKTTIDKVGESVAKIMEPTFNEAQEPLRNAFIDLMTANEQRVRDFGKVDSKERQIVEALTPEMVSNPYTDEVYALFSNNNDPISHYDDLALTYYFTSPAFKNTEGQEIVGGGLGLLESLIETISNDYLDLVEDKRSGKFEDISLPDITGLLPDEVNDLRYKFLYDLHRSGLWSPFQHRKEEPLEEIPLAQFSTNTEIVNHSLVGQFFKKAYEIAKGDSGVAILEPRSGKSNESYELSATPKYCRDYFKTGAGDKDAKAVLDAVISLIKDEQAIECKYLGRVWLSAASIVEKVSETTAGTIRGRENKQALEIVNAALLMMRDFSIVGRDPAGMPINTMRVLDAEQRKQITCNGNTYYGVWGFRVETYSIDDYANELKHRRIYPKLQSDKPLSFSEGSIKNELLGVLNQLRGDLYKTSKDGHPQKRPNKSKSIQKLSWPGIFDSTSRIRELDSRQKKKVVKQYEKVLKLLAEQDAHNELVEGRPLYIKAYSERDAGRGRGKGAWKNLVIEASNHLHTPEIDLFK